MIGQGEIHELIDQQAAAGRIGLETQLAIDHVLAQAPDPRQLGNAPRHHLVQRPSHGEALVALPAELGRWLRLGPNFRCLFVLWLFGIVAVTLSLLDNPRDPTNWQVSFLQAFIMATPTAAAFGIVWYITDEMGTGVALQVFALWIAFVVGILVYDLLFPLFFGGTSDFVGGLRVCVQVLPIWIAGGIMKWLRRGR